MKSKKSLELSLTTVAVAVLVLGVVVVLFIIFTSGSQKFAKSINDCWNGGGDCISATECKSTQLNLECPKGKVCCARNVGFI